MLADRLAPLATWPVDGDLRLAVIGAFRPDSLSIRRSYPWGLDRRPEFSSGVRFRVRLLRLALRCLQNVGFPGEFGVTGNEVPENRLLVRVSRPPPSIILGQRVFFISYYASLIPLR